jgi:cardiolipin synthase
VLSILLTAVEVAIVVVALFVVPRGRTPATAIAWLLLIVVLPLVGIVLFAILGSNHLPPSRRRKEQAAVAVIRTSARRLGSDRLPLGAPDWASHVVTLAHTLGAMPMLGGNRIQVTTELGASFDAMIAEIDQAHRTVNVQFYILVCDERTEPVFAALERAIQRGVAVRVLLDGWASYWISGARRTRRRLHDMGSSWSYMLPLRPLWGELQRPDLRNHRKIVTVDGQVAFTGSLNLISDDYNRPRARRAGMAWVDVLVRVEGASALELESVFATDWYLETGQQLPRPQSVDIPVHGGTYLQVVPSGPGYALESNLKVFLSLLHHARERVTIVSPYFVPNEAMLYALSNAVNRGVDVELFVSEKGDHLLVAHAQASYYEQLLVMGVRIQLYRQPHLLHTKFVIVDGAVVAVGSSNMDMRSFSLNMEVTLLGVGDELIETMTAVADSYRRSSRPLDLEEWRRRPLLLRGFDNLLRLTSALQ